MSGLPQQTPTARPSRSADEYIGTGTVTLIPLSSPDPRYQNSEAKVPIYFPKRHCCKAVAPEPRHWQPACEGPSALSVSPAQTQAESATRNSLTRN